MYSKNREIDREVRKLIAAGWTFRRGGKHGRLLSPEGRMALTVPVTPSDHRSPLNFRSQIRRAMARCHEHKTQAAS